MRTIFTLKGSHGEECFPPFAQETFLNIHTKDLKILTELEILKRVTHLFRSPHFSFNRCKMCLYVPIF